MIVVCNSGVQPLEHRAERMIEGTRPKLRSRCAPRGVRCIGRRFIHRLGEIRDRIYENQQHRASGLNLLVTAIILWNTRYLARAIAALRACPGRRPRSSPRRKKPV